MASSRGAPDMAAPFCAVRWRHREARAMLEELVAGGAEGLVLIQDSATCEGRSLLRTFVTAAVQRAEPVLVLLGEVSREQFEAGLSPAVRQRLQFHDGFQDPLGWLSSGVPQRVGGALWDLLSGLGVPTAAGRPPTLVLDSLSWLLLRLPPPELCQRLLGWGAAGGSPQRGACSSPRRLLALLHGDLHPPKLLGALGALASTHLVLEKGPPRLPSPTQPGPDAPRLVTILSAPRKGKEPRKVESFTLLPDGSLRVTEEKEGEGRPLPPSAGTPPNPQGLGPLPFRLRLSQAERQAKEAVPPPYLLSTPRISSLLRTPGASSGTPETPPHDEDPQEEDPDDDLDV